MASPAIILSSGGLDSTTCLAVARQRGFAPLYSMTFDYGQRHRQELDAAASIAKAFEVREHRVITIDLRAFGHSALTAEIDAAVTVGNDSGRPPRARSLHRSLSRRPGLSRTTPQQL